MRTRIIEMDAMFAPDNDFGRSVRSNGQLLTYCRKQCGLTQIDLAARSGFSRRVIVKAEGNGDVERETIEIIAEKLREAGASVSGADLVSDPASLARRFLKNYATHQADCVQHCLDFIAHDIMAVVDGDPATNPIAGAHRGIDEFDGLWRKFFSIFGRVGGTLAECPETICMGKEVIAWGDEEIHLHGVP